MATPVIRTATGADLAHLISLESRIPPLGESQIAPFAHFSADDVDELSASGAPLGARILVATRRGDVVGYAYTKARISDFGVADRASTVLLLQRLAVLPDSQRSGVGKALLSELERLTAHDPRSMVQAHVPESAIGFYESQGWTVLDPELALAWIEVPTTEMWEAAQAAGIDAGPRRKATVLRVEDPSLDASTGHGRVAFKVLREDLLSEHFAVEHATAPSALDAAMFKIAHQIRENPQRRKDLPPYVSRAVFDMVLTPLLGRDQANELRRA
ncbi:GNAT family N-acetyltransferase [Microbacterium sp. ISL-103]|uniref:GNAT family N-acetyltransferase n=1 Tax=Microbacterium sp. ISL-103 TaxID=2819156 RepID=UPI001BEC55FD|nr:GNAT family N-acetyltransferase [Microbacterium sp. ISL-103]MBT2474272.1 GNAT family N-acetyltransferase [Microbacterium sp. ISL-103]